MGQEVTVVVVLRSESGLSLSIWTYTPHESLTLELCV